MSGQNFPVLWHGRYDVRVGTIALDPDAVETIEQRGPIHGDFMFIRDNAHKTNVMCLSLQPEPATPVNVPKRMQIEGAVLMAISKYGGAVIEAGPFMERLVDEITNRVLDLDA